MTPKERMLNLQIDEHICHSEFRTIRGKKYPISSPPEDPNYCLECRHFSNKPSLYSDRTGETLYLCDNPVFEHFDPVTGERLRPFCRDLRAGVPTCPVFEPRKNQ